MLLGPMTNDLQRNRALFAKEPDDPLHKRLTGRISRVAEFLFSVCASLLLDGPKPNPAQR